MAAAASGDSSTSGHFFWLQREQQGPESEAGPCTVWRCWRCGQTCSMLGGPGDSLWRTQAGGSRGGAGPGDPAVTRGETHPRGESPEAGRETAVGARLPAHLGRGRWLVCTSCRLWYSFSSSSSAAAFSVGSCSQHLALGSQGGPVPAPTPAHSPLPSPGCVPFPPQLTEQERAAPPATPVRGPGCPRRAGGERQSTARRGDGARPPSSPFFSVIRRTKTPMVSSLVSSGRQAGLVPGGEREPPGFQGRSRWDPLLLAGYARTWQQRAPQAWVCAPRASALPQLLPPSLLSTTAPAAPGAERFQGPLNSTIPHTVYGMGASLSQGLPSPQPKGAVGGLSAQNPHQPQHTACHTLSLGLSLRPVFFVTNQGPRPQGHENGPNNQSWASSRVLGLAPRQQPAS